MIHRYDARLDVKVEVEVEVRAKAVSARERVASVEKVV
jgi:hypothetical protein